MLEGRPRLRLAVVHGGLFLLTCVTTTLINGLDVGANGEVVFDAVAGFSFSATLMAILVAHEMGHFLVAKRHRVEVSLPYFIPLPIGIGTLGAIIRMPPVRSRNALVEIGAAGPLAGLVVALPCLILGLHLSPVEPVVPGGLLEGNSLAYLSLKYLVKGELLPGGGRDVFLHEVAFAAWVGLLVTMINLIPIGQLDGGHIAYGYFGDRHDRTSGVLHIALVPIGLVVLYVVGRQAQLAGVPDAFGAGMQGAMPWFVWALMLGILRRISKGRWHPAVGDEPLGPRARFIAHVVLVVFILIFVPIPFRGALP